MDNFDYKEVEKHGGKNGSVQFMFVCFVITIGLIIMNLLLAVTIGKTDQLSYKSKLIQAKRRINDIVQSADARAYSFYRKKSFSWFQNALNYITFWRKIKTRKGSVLKQCRENKTLKVVPMFLGDILGRAKAKKQYYLFFVLIGLHKR